MTTVVVSGAECCVSRAGGAHIHSATGKARWILGLPKRIRRRGIFGAGRIEGRVSEKGKAGIAEYSRGAADVGHLEVAGHGGSRAGGLQRRTTSGRTGRRSTCLPRTRQMAAE